MLLLIWNYLDARTSSEEGATMVEYGLMVALIAVVVMATVGPLGGVIAQLFTDVSTAITG